MINKWYITFNHINYALLAIIGGALNGYSLLSFGFTVSHQTGNVTRSVVTSLNGIPERFYYILLPILFVFGAFVAGLIFPFPRRHISKRYGLSLLFLGCFLLGMDYFNLPAPIYLLGLSWMAGFQNSIILYFQGIQIRTTFMSGPLSNFGYLLAQVVKGHLYNLPIVLNQLFIISSYLVGVWLGVTMHRYTYSLTWLTIFYFMGALIFYYIAYLTKEGRHE